ncbi:MAG: translation elongation factor Ts [Acidiferrobacterales bacterium]|nr:translation elongation factor Ts [Acidiferrobacterales bacterium]
MKLDITAVMVKQLRDRTGAGMMDCKKVLVECDGDQDKAVEILRKKGAEMAASRSGRTASEGLIVCAMSESRDCGSLVEINCETDFVSRGDVFRGFAGPLAGIALGIGDNCEDVNVLNTLPFDESGKTVEEMRLDVLSKIRENITISRVVTFRASDNAIIGSYVHRERLGIMVEIAGDAGSDVADDIAVHIAVKKPLWLDVADIPSATIEKEREIYLEQARGSGKPDHILERIVEGKISKFSKENTLVNQPYYEDEDKTVESLLKESDGVAKRFCLINLGQG